ncbi:amino acid/amide ABC transporter membrane protein 1, HAAT family [Jatrophihabitans endophyticus]|uniref:Amino acid/amide ABC transporter membrane protein 1, HAAT family n=1 Tax=Jatrophihabitans endophyticus TaxID=1206085 RepID=A0A1M5M050_9ACTN|nr:branched-chain amino acid ABC transporter permease [Jatrophihabitans endophyticus]SHG70712.1 amino acid/amide ABC transporter membrane protein 1, HAAT family [Jatrophihabitans endophyticus]
MRGRTAGLLAVLAVAVVAGGYAKAGSGQVVMQAIVTGILSGGIYGLVAMGLTLIFGVLDIVNFAHGAFLMVAMFVTYAFVSGTGTNPYLALVVAVLALLVLGGLVQGGLLNRTMGRPLENQLLITLGVSLLLTNVALLVYGGDPHSVGLADDRRIRVLGAVTNLSRVLAFAGSIVLALVLFVVLNRTRLGAAIRAVASNSEGAALVGIDVRKVYIATFAIGTACAGAAGMLVAPFTTITPSSGNQYTIIAFVVVVMGSKGNAVGALVSGLIIGLVEQFGGVLLPGQSPLLAVFVVFVLVLFLRPQGLFGRPA